MKNYWKFIWELIVFLLVYSVVRLGFYFFPEGGPIAIEVIAVMVATLAVVSLFLFHISSLTEDNRVLLASLKMLIISLFGIVLWKITIDDGLGYKAIVFAGVLLVIFSTTLLANFFGTRANRSMWRQTLLAILIQTGVIVLFMWQFEYFLPRIF